MPAKIGFDKVSMDGKIIRETDDELVMSAVIAREIIQPYPEGKAYKPAEELERAADDANERFVVLLKHPPTGLVTRRQDVAGRMKNVRFAKDITDPKTKRPMIRGIRADVHWQKKALPPEIQEQIKTGALHDVSIGFVYDEDRTPGEWNGERYDFVQRDIFIDHLVAPCELGRCPSPYCGLGVDSIIKPSKIGGEEKKEEIKTMDKEGKEAKEQKSEQARKIAGDPWEETEEYIRSGHREPSDECRTKTLSEEQGIKAIICNYDGKWEIQSFLFAKAKDWTMEKAKTWYNEHKGDSFETTADQEGVREKAKQEQETRASESVCPIKAQIEQLGTEGFVKKLKETFTDAELSRLVAPLELAKPETDLLKESVRVLERAKRLLKK